MNPLTKLILRSPTMWSAATKVALARVLRCRQVTVKRAGLRISCGTSTGQGSFCAIAGPDYEPELRWLLHQLQPGDTFVDVGANIGVYSLHVARKLKSVGSVFALEPSPDAFKLLQQNIEMNSFGRVVTTIHAAASCREGQLYLAGDPKKWNSLQLHENPPGAAIRVTTIDHVLAAPDKRACFHFLKIDAEGVESDVLEGATESITGTWPTIIFENSINRSEKLPTSWLREKGYSIHAINRGQRVTLSPSDYVGYTNLIAIHPKSRFREHNQLG